MLQVIPLRSSAPHVRLSSPLPFGYGKSVNPVLEDPETRGMVYRISRDAYQAFGRLGILNEDVELIQGIILRKVPKPPLHILLVRRLFDLLQASVARSRSAGSAPMFVAKEDPIATPDSEPEPDLAVLPGKPDDYGASLPTTALLVIEVAVSTTARDHRKAALYAEAAVPEYWIVDGEQQRIERFSAPGPGTQEYQKHEIFSGEQVVTSFQLPDFSVPPAELFRNP